MENKIFLLKNKSKFSVNDRNFIDLRLENHEQIANSTDLSETISLYDLYNSERDNCEKFRLIFNVNPICSNILFNNVTEIIKNEGSSGCTVIDRAGKNISGYTNKTSLVDRIQAIRDTEYSEDYTYHCGYDIFNNHILRANNFPFIGPMNSGSSATCANVFNTFADFSRDNNGNIIQSLSYTSTDNTMKNMHVYNTDTLDGMDTAFNEKCEENEGWFGFYNRTLIDIPNAGKNINKTINRTICNQKTCSFIDMYPDRSLFSFAPKYNEYRHRTENNWDYCITYPYKSDKDLFNTINGNNINALKIYSYEIGTTSSGIQLVRFKSLFKHNLKKGSYVNIYYSDKKSDDSPVLLSQKILVRSVGDANRDDSDKIFNVNFDDIRTHLKIEDGQIRKKGGNFCNFYFKKNTNGCESEYYFRIFKKIYTNEESGITPHSEINKLSFAKNIFGDNIAQILYTDDIDITGLVDNIGRPLSSIYLTVVKRNKGHNTWYCPLPIYNDETIEYSHCFGEVTSGVDLPNDYTDYNIHKLHNINLSNIDSSKDYYEGTVKVFSNFTSRPKTIESGITIDDMDEFVGDIAEFNRYTFTETVIDYVYHRFNTAQREYTYSNEYEDIYEDFILHDDYDYSSRGFRASSTTINAANIIGNIDELPYLGNLNPEGYFYNPHYRIKIREVSDNLSSLLAYNIAYDGDIYGTSGITVENIVSTGNYEYTIPYLENYEMETGNLLAFYNLNTDTIYWGAIMGVSDNKIIVDTETEIPEDDFKTNLIFLYYVPGTCPTYAKFIFSKDSFVWRECIAVSKLTNSSDIFDTPFSNGAFYVEKNINFFLRRQDPHGEYYMSNPEENPVTPLAFAPSTRKFKKFSLGKFEFDGIKNIEDLFNSSCE